MASSAQNSAKKQGNAPVFLCFRITIFFVLHHVSTRVSAQSKAVFACDVKSNPGLANYSFCDPELPVGERVTDLVKRLTLEEKITFLGDSAGSVSRLGIPKYEWWSEALHGVSYVGPGTKFSSVVPNATSFPQVILTAASFNVTLFETIGKVCMYTSIYLCPLCMCVRIHDTDFVRMFCVYVVHLSGFRSWVCDPYD